MSDSIDRLITIARAEGDAPSTERDANGSTIHSMTRPMSSAVNAAGRSDVKLAYSQSADRPSTEGFVDQATGTKVLFPAAATATRTERALGGAPVKKPPALWLILLLGIAGALQFLLGAFGNVSILRMGVGLLLLITAFGSWRQRRATMKGSL